MADTLSAVVTADAATYDSGATINVTVTFTNGDTAQTITGFTNLSGQATLLSNVASLVGKTIATGGDTAFNFTASVRSGQTPDLAMTLNWGFTTTTHNIAATGVALTIRTPAYVGGQWPSDTN